MDFRNYGSYRPDVIVRRKALMRNDGLGQEHIFHHHGDKYTQNHISWYDEHYNGRYKENTLPSLRDWNSHKLSWAPEKSDHPIQGTYVYPTIFISVERSFTVLFICLSFCIQCLLLKKMNKILCTFIYL